MHKEYKDTEENRTSLVVLSETQLPQKQLLYFLAFGSTGWEELYFY